MAVSPVVINICNSALIKLGVTPINDFTDDSKEARLCEMQYDRVRDAVLRSAPWSFALKRVVLAPSTDTLVFGDGTVYKLPVDCVKFVKLYDSRSTFVVEGEDLICSDEDVKGWYVTNSVAPEKYDPSFSEALAYALAADLCYSLVQSDTMRQGLLAGMKAFMEEARSYTSQENTPEDYQFDYFDSARRGSSAIYNEPNIF